MIFHPRPVESPPIHRGYTKPMDERPPIDFFVCICLCDDAHRYATAGTQVLQATGVCAGVAIFSLADSIATPRFSFAGIVFATGSVAASAVTGNMQKRAMGESKRQLQRCKATAEEVPASAVLRGKGMTSPKSKGDR